MVSSRKIINRWITAFVIASLTVSVSMAQSVPDTGTKIPMPTLGPLDTIPVPAAIHQAEYIPLQTMDWVWVQVPYPPHLLKKRKEWTRLRNAIYVTYPYARRASIILNDINAKLANVTDKSERKKYIKSREAELRKEFAEPLTNLSVYQGRVLMKLINRQTGNNCYEIIKEYKGGVTARFYQTVAFFFNSSLKQPYDRTDGDREMESIVVEVEQMYRM